MTDRNQHGPLLSIAILARDEAAYLPDCLASLQGLDAEVVVIVDSAGRDTTADIAAAWGATVYHAAWRGFSGQRNLALDYCNGSWVFFLDADERLSSDLRAELQHLMPSLHDPAVGGFRVPRLNFFFGRPVRGGGWYPDYQLRLLRRQTSRFDEQVHVHEVADISGREARLSGHLLHINIESLGEFGRKQAQYAWAEARSRLTARRPARRRNLAGGPLREFVYRYITLAAWRDGPLGLFLAGSLAWYEFLTQLMWRALIRR